MTLLERVAAGVVLADGAMGTLGFSERDSLGPVPSMWPIEDPEIVESIHGAYVDAGAELLLTCTFGASRGWLAMHGSESRLAEINSAAVEAARGASPSGTLIAGDVGPAAAGRDSAATSAEAMYREQIESLVAAGVDAILVETMMSIEDARNAVAAANQVRAGVPLIVSMTFDAELRARDGSSPEMVADEVCALGIDLIGVNCCDGPRTTLAVVERLVRFGPVPVFAKPSAGLPRDDGSYAYGPERFARWARRIVDAGARVVGGCCGTTPAHIAACRSMLGHHVP